jgi:Flp pilus assembly protein TadD
MLKPFQRAPHLQSEFCSACHKVSLSEPFDNYRWFRGFDTWDEYQDSGVSGFSARSFYQPAHPMECADCHMPMVASQDFGNIAGFVHSHRFPAANTALPTVKGCPEQLAITRKFLQGTVTVDLFAAGDPNATVMQAPMESAPITVRPGHKLRVDLVVRTRGVGHAFPSGTTDAVETWTEFKATDARGRIIFWSGFTRPDGTVDPTAHFFHTVLVDQHGNKIDKRNAWQRRATVYNEAIPPGAAKVVRYRMDIPKDAKLPLTLEAHLWYRKFDSYFNRFSFDGHVDTRDPQALTRYDKGWDDRPWRIDGDKHPDIAAVAISSARVQLGPGAHNQAPPWPLWQRYNDYGIGMLLATDYRLADWAWEAVTKLNPGDADGYVNRARAALGEGSDAEARQWLERALKLDPTFYKAHYFMGLVDKNAGRYEDAARELESVAARFPEDRVVHNVLGRLYLLLGQYDQAIAHYHRVLDIDPQDMTAHQGLMLSYDGKGDDRMAREHEARFLRFRPEETETQYNEPYLLAHPHENVEAQPIHEHISGDWQHAGH